MKRMLKEYYEMAEHEVELLRRSDDHPNVVRYFCSEADGEFLYIALEVDKIGGCKVDVWVGG